MANNVPITPMIAQATGYPYCLSMVGWTFIKYARRVHIRVIIATMPIDILRMSLEAS